MNFRLAHDLVVLIETEANLCCSRRKANNFFPVFFSSFELGGITKHLMTGPAGNSDFCFPSTKMFPSASPGKTFEGLGETKLTVSPGQSLSAYS